MSAKEQSPIPYDSQNLTRRFAAPRNIEAIRTGNSTPLLDPLIKDAFLNKYQRDLINFHYGEEDIESVKEAMALMADFIDNPELFELTNEAIQWFYRCSVPGATSVLPNRVGVLTPNALSNNKLRNVKAELAYRPSLGRNNISQGDPRPVLIFKGEVFAEGSWCATGEFGYQVFNLSDWVQPIPHAEIDQIRAEHC